MTFGDLPDIRHHTALLQLAGLDVHMRAVTTAVNDDPLPSVENPTHNALNKSNVDRLKSAKRGVLPKSLLPSRFALLDDREEKGLGFLEVEL